MNEYDVALLRANNPGMLTLSGTNTWVVGRDPAWIVDPGPALADHVEAVLAEAEARGGVGGIALTHDHIDHVEALAVVRERTGAPVAAARGDVDLTLADGERAGPFEAVATPGHAPDHLAFLYGKVCFTGDAVLGEGSVGITADLSRYLDALRRLRELDLELLCPGHGPVITNPAGKLDEYVAHRLDRERKLVAALERGLRSKEDLLDAAWDDVPPPLRPMAAQALRAHLEKLREEDRLAGWPDRR